MRGSEVRVLFPAPFPGRRASRPVARRPPPGASGGELRGMAFKLDRNWPAQKTDGRDAIGPAHKELRVGTNPEHVPDALAAHSEPVRWIGRDRPGFDRITPDSPVHPTSPHTAPTEAPQPGLRRKWLLPAGAVLLALAISAGLWSTLHSKPKLVPLADQRNVPRSEERR